MKSLALTILSVLIFTQQAASATSFLGSTATEVSSGTGDVQVLAADNHNRLTGFSCRENAGTPAAAEFIIRNGTSTSAPAVAFVRLNASESVREYFGEGIQCPKGIFIDRISGTTHLTVYSTKK
jgi:hypothetical protein